MVLAHRCWFLHTNSSWIMFTTWPDFDKMVDIPHKLLTAYYVPRIFQQMVGVRVMLIFEVGMFQPLSRSWSKVYIRTFQSSRCTHQGCRTCWVCLLNGVRWLPRHIVTSFTRSHSVTSCYLSYLTLVFCCCGCVCFGWDRRCTRRSSEVTTSCRASGRSSTRTKFWASQWQCELTTCIRALLKTCRWSQSSNYY